MTDVTCTRYKSEMYTYMPVRVHAITENAHVFNVHADLHSAYINTSMKEESLTSS